MSQTLSVNLSFSADTAAAKQQLNDLQNTLSKIASAPTSSLGNQLATDINKASVAAAELKTHLTNATNVQTGTLDFSKLNQSISKSGKSLSDYANQLNRLGPEGKQAFMQLANAVSQSEIPIRRSNKLLNDMAITFKNTAKWQLSSSVLHGFMGAMQSAYGYAKDLNASLNDIRIVTGYNVDKMSQFAVEANKAAKALSTTTNDYTNASLIYFQQGLNDQQVKDRTDITIKMANVSRQSAEVVSDQMTAVWNNFYDGSKSLEYYADVMTALGAATASSTDEIAAGLEKFAAISDIVGLSYEYATAALATVTAETRQSAEVVGTAFKAMFARIQGLKLGETLEDGTNLNKYSEALAAVGVNIKDANGELKNMDIILNEMAEIWSGLNRDQQVALAQTVAGVRQYNQLVSLMNNWDVMEQNLGTVSGSEGALQEQADIYAESWEAAGKRVTAAAENIWDSLLNDEFFIDILNGFEDFLTLIGKVVDSLGGMKGVLLAVSTILLKTFNSQISSGLSEMAMSMSLLSKSGREMQAQQRSEFLKESAAIMAGTGADTATPRTDKIASSGYEEQLRLQEQLTQNIKNMSDLEISTAQQIIAARQKQLDLVIQTSQKVDESAAEKSRASMRMRTEANVTAENSSDYSGTKNAYAKYEGKIGELETSLNNFNAEQSEQALNNLINTLVACKESMGATAEQSVEFKTRLQENLANAADAGEQLDILEQDIADVQRGLESMSNSQKTKLEETFNVSAEATERFGAACRKTSKDSKSLEKEQKILNDQTIRASISMSQARGSLTTWSQIAVKTASSISSLAMSFSMVNSMISTLKDPNTSGWEKFTTVLMTTGMLIPSVISAVNGLRTAYASLATTQGVLQAVQRALNSEEQANIAITTLKQTLSQANVDLANKENAQNLLRIVTSKNLTDAEKQQLIVDQLSLTVEGEKMDATTASMILEQAQQALRSKTIVGKMAETVQTWSQVVAEKAHQIALQKTALSYIAAYVAVKPLLFTILALSAAIVGLVAITTAVAYGFKAFAEALHATETEAKDAQDYADKMSQKYQDLTEEANKFKEAVTGYEDAVESLKTLEKGTDEYRTALEKANEEAERLIELYGLWDMIEGRDQDGLIIFKEGSLEGVQSQKDSAAKDAKWDSNAAKVVSNEKQATLDFKELKEEIGTIITKTVDTYDGSSREKVGTTEVDTFLSDDDLMRIVAVTSQFKNAGEMSEQAFGDALEASGIFTGSLEGCRAAIVQYQDAFVEAAKNFKEKSAENDYRTQQMIADSVEKSNYGKTINNLSKDSTGEVNDGLKNKILDTAAIGLNRIQKQQGTDLQTKLASVDVSDKTTNRSLREYEGYKDIQFDEDLIRKYAQVILGKTAEEVEAMDYKGGNGVGNLKTADGQNVFENDLNDKYMRQQLAKHAEYNQIEADYEDQIESENSAENQYMQALEGLVEGGNALGQELGANVTEALLNSLQEGTETFDLKSMFGGLSEEEKDSLIDLDTDGLLQKLGMTKEEIANLGYESAEAFEQAFDEGLSQWTPELAKEDFLADLNSKTAEDASAFGLDPEILQDVAEGFAEMAEAGVEGYEGLNENAELASDAATRYVRLQEAVLDLSENYDDYEEVLTGVRKAANKVDKAYAMNSESGKKLKTTLAGLLGTTEDLIDADLVGAIDPKDFEAAAKGDQAAIERIRSEFMRLQAEANGIDFDGLKNEIAALEDGASLDLDIDSFLSNLITAKLNAGASATDIENMLSGFGIDMDNITFYDSLEKAKVAAAATGGIIADELSYTEQTETEATEIEKNGSEGSFTENISSDSVTEINKVTETDADGNITEREIPSTLYSFTKTVAEDTIPTQETETITTTEKQVTTGTGQEGSTQPKKAAVITGKKSVGNKVSPGTTNAAKNNSGGGKGGGKTSTPAEKVKKTKKSDVVDRYKEVTDALDDNTRALDKATKKADALYGPARIKWLKEANKLITQQNTLLQKQINQAKTNLDNDRDALQKVGEEVGLGKNAFSFDANGNITNYTTQLEKLFDQLHQAEIAMGNLATKEEQDEYKDKFLQPIQDKIDLLKEYLVQYEETRELIEDLEDQMEDNLRQIENNKSAQISHVIELKIDVNDEELKQLEFLLKRLEARGEFGIAESITTMQGQLPIYQNQAAVAEEGLERYLSEWLTPDEKKLFYSGKSDQIDWGSKENLPDDFFEKIFGYVDSYQEATENAIQLRSDVYDALNQAFSDLTSEIDRSIDMFDKYNSVIDHYTNIIDLSGMKNAFTTEELQKFNQEKVNNANNKLESSLSRKESAAVYAEDRKAEYDSDVAVRETILEKLKTAKGKDKESLEAELEQIEATIKESKKAWQDAEDYAIESNEEYLAAWEEALQTSRDVFLANAQLEIDELEKQMAGAYGSIEAMQEEFDKNSEINDRYLEDYERVYELTKLTRDLNKKMDETTNIKAKKELAKLQEQILFYQEEGRKMSDYDLEYLQKRYDLKLAEIAMEEAQNAKSEVRLTRDNEGNYSYTYVADENQLANSQQNYEDKLFAITDLSNEHIKEQSQLLIQTQQEYVDALAEIAQKAAEGQYATAEEHQKAIEECTAYYVGKMNYHGSEVDRAIQNNAIIYKGDYETYEVYAGKKLTASEKLQKEMDADILESEALTLKLQQEKQAARDEVHLQYARGLIKDTTAYENELKKIDEKYDGRIDEADKKTKNMIVERNRLYGADAGNYDAARIKKEASEKGFITNLKTTFLPQLDNVQATGAGFVKRTTDAIGDPKKGTGYLGQASKSFKQMEENIAGNMKAAGIALDENGKVKVDEFKEKVKQDLVDGKDSVSKKSAATKDSILKLTDSLSNKKTGLTATASGVHSWAVSIGKDVSSLITKFDKLSTAALSAKDAIAQQAEAELDDNKCPKCKKNPCVCKPDDGGGDTSEGDGVLRVGDEVTYVSGKYYYDSAGTAPAGTRGQGKKATVTKIVSGAAYPIHLKSTDSAYGWVKKSQISGYDTGGYTGDWGPEGKLAMLHEKELVLNKQDTENMLKIISMVRDLSTALDFQAYQASLAQLQANQLHQVNSGREIFEQTVTIHADFPSATQSFEIETALKNLVNSASQYANRKY